MSRSIQYLSRFCAEQRLEKKYLILPSYQIGHQIGEALAKEGGSWVNLNFASLPSLAQEEAALELSRQEKKLVSQANALFVGGEVRTSVVRGHLRDGEEGKEKKGQSGRGGGASAGGGEARWSGWSGKGEERQEYRHIRDIRQAEGLRMKRGKFLIDMNTTFNDVITNHKQLPIVCD